VLVPVVQPVVVDVVGPQPSQRLLAGGDHGRSTSCSNLTELSGVVVQRRHMCIPIYAVDVWESAPPIHSS
jgi:hypothetical protein